MSSGSAFRQRLGEMSLGIRLAIVGGRTPWGRLALSATGIGMGVAVLLLTASLQTVADNREHRMYQRDFGLRTTNWTGDPTLLVQSGNTFFRDNVISSVVLEVRRPDAPTPPGVPRHPRPGDTIVSPKLLELINSPGGDLLRPRLGHVAGVIGEDGLVSPDELFYYHWVDHIPTNASTPVYRHFNEAAGSSQDAATPLLTAFGITALLVPVVVFVTSTTRLAETARQRRLAAMRLVGASARQIRRIASAEALVGATTGVVFGWLLFVFLNRLLSTVLTGEFSLFESELWPPWSYALLISLGIPALARIVAVASMRRTITQPVGVLRQTTARPRRLAWRCVPSAVGVLGLLQARIDAPDAFGGILIHICSAVLILASVPLILPYAVERLVHLPSPDKLSWQLALRRLQVSSGTAARSVSAVAVVLTGVIALQTALTSYWGTPGDVPTTSGRKAREVVMAVTVEDIPAEEPVRRAMEQELAAKPGVRHVARTEQVTLEREDRGTESIRIVDCPTLLRQGWAAHCRSGDIFYLPGEDGRPRPHGQALYLSSGYEVGPELLRLPERLPELGGDAQLRIGSGMLVFTPHAARTVPADHRIARIDLSVQSRPALVEEVRNIVARYLPTASVTGGWPFSYSTRENTLTMMRYGLILGSSLVFALIGCGLYVTAAEQMQERRRPMAVLGAVGARRGDLLRSLLLQNAIPMAVSLVVSIPFGLGLGALVALTVGTGQVAVDMMGLVSLVGFAALAVLIVTALAFPALSRAMAPEGLRTE